MHGLVTVVYTCACVQGCVHGRERAVYTARAQCVTTIFFAKDTFYAETFSYKSITFKKS